MTCESYYQCDSCGLRIETDLTPEGWSIGAKDYCKKCKERMKYPRAATHTTGEDR